MGALVGKGPAARGEAGPADLLGLDIGGTKLAAGVVDHEGRVTGFVVEPTKRERGPELVIQSLLELGNRALAEAGRSASDIDGVGIACGGPLDAARGVLVAPSHLPGWRDVAIVEIVESEWDRPAVLENDATAAAAAEHRHGAGQGLANMVYLTISTGVGGGAIVDGRLFRGATGSGGEFGHVTLDRNGRHCRSCGRDGCLEAYVSGTSIAERAAEAMDPSSTLAELEEVSAEAVAEAARSGDRYAAALWSETTDALACGLVSIVNLFEPELLVLGGGVTRAGEQLLAPVRSAVRSQAMPPMGGVVRVVVAGLGDQVGVVGAASGARERWARGA